jgi:hypothetical protein
LKEVIGTGSHSPLDPKQIVSFEELLMSHVIQEEALTRLLVEKGVFTKEELLDTVRGVDEGINRKESGR